MICHFCKKPIGSVESLTIYFRDETNLNKVKERRYYCNRTCLAKEVTKQIEEEVHDLKGAWTSSNAVHSTCNTCNTAAATTKVKEKLMVSIRADSKLAGKPGKHQVSFIGEIEIGEGGAIESTTFIAVPRTEKVVDNYEPKVEKIVAPQKKPTS